jgi:hypothetical protein
MSETSDDASAEAPGQHSKAVPYPSWADMVANLRRDRPDTAQAASPTPATSREWSDVVADLIVDR